jgi:hypothetical protein
MLTIEICPNEPRADFVDVSGYIEDIINCTASGDCEPACGYVRDHIGVQFRIIAKNDRGEYENRPATESEIERTARAIYFDSESDLSDMNVAALYLIWDAAHNAESNGELDL